MITRREFIIKASLAAGAAMLPLSGCWHPKESSTITPVPGEQKFSPISQQEKPLAIAMWDFSWILRHHRYGEFEDWNRVLDGLAERGYNAIRVDAMPQFVAADSDGRLLQEFRSVKDEWLPSVWGNDYTMSFRPREALLEFLPLCEKHGIKVGLATWFFSHGTGRKAIFMEEGGLVRAWNETLSFLRKNDLLRNVIYVDILNEYPINHGFDWLKNELDKSAERAASELAGAGAAPIDTIAVQRKAIDLRRQLTNTFLTETLKTLKAKHPGLDFFASLDSAADLTLVDVSECAALDYHLWFDKRGNLPGLGPIASRNQALDQRKAYAELQQFWRKNGASYVTWMEERLNEISRTAAADNIVCGNTEGWGPVLWYDHPDLDWNWVKKSAEICIDLARRHDNYKFLCTSNFTHPQFKGLWEDVGWHRTMTSKIKA